MQANLEVSGRRFSAPLDDSKLNNWLRLSKLGPIFPIRPNDKRPPKFFGWTARCSSDPETIHSWFSRDYRGYNVALVTGRHYEDGFLVVIDLDFKNGKNGLVAFDKLCQEYGVEIPKTLSVLTPNNGKHLFFKTQNQLECPKPGNGIDIQGFGAYVLAPGSEINGIPYKFEDSTVPVAWLPKPIEDIFHSRKPKAKVEKIEGIDEKRSEQRFIHFLQNDCPTALSGERNNECFRVASHAKEIGVNHGSCIALMSEYWPCEPMLNTDEFETTVGSAYKSKINNPQGALAPEAEFTKIPDEHPFNSSKKIFPFQLFRDIKTDFSRPHLVANLLAPDSLSILFGASSAGKTFIALDMAFSIARGEKWFGRKVTRGAVLYAALEGGETVKKRISAYRQANKLDNEDIPFALMSHPIDLLNERIHLKQLVDTVGAIQKQLAEPINLIVVDTLSRALVGGNENSSEAIGAFIKNIDQLRVHTKAHVMVIHHSGKDREKGARGHSSLRAAADTEIEVANSTLKVTKQRDLEIGHPIGFFLETVELGTDCHGERVSSCIVKPRSLGAIKDFSEIELDGQSSKVFSALKDLVSLYGETGIIEKGIPEDCTPVLYEMWKSSVRDQLFPNASRSTWSSAFSRSVKKIDAAKLIVRRGKYVWLSDQS